MSWYVMQLRQKYTRQTSRKQFYDRLRTYYNKAKEDIYISLTDKNLGMNYYVFIRQLQMPQFWKTIKKDKCINEQYGYYEIQQGQVHLLMEDVQYIREQIGYGDIVKILQGRYSKLYGVVLRQRQNQNYEIGLKFCNGVRTQIIKGTWLQITGNIFNYVKVSK